MTSFGEFGVGSPVEEPLTTSRWGARFGTLRDRFSVRWLVYTAAVAA